MTSKKLESVPGSKGRMACAGRALVLGVAAAFLGLCGCRSIPLAARDPDPAVQARRDFALSSSLRGLPQRQKVAIEKETVASLRASLAQELEKDDSRAYLASSELLLKQFRILKPTDDLKQIFLRVMEDQVAAYYDPEKKRVAYVEGAGGAATNVAQLPGMERFVYVHEFCHALEDGHFDLDRLGRESLDSFDRSQAMTSLSEGDAVLVGLDGVLAEVPMNSATPFGGALVSLLGRMSGEGAEGMPKDCPAFLGGALLRPYLDGAVFANRIRREAGWRAIDAVYTNRLPTTTAEILYPERRYLRGFRPAAFEPPAALFRDAVRGMEVNSMGVQGTALWLGGDRLVAPREYGFLEGWLGDRVYLLKGDGGDVTTVWMTYLEGSGQAYALERRIMRRLRKTFGDSPWSVSRQGPLVVAVWMSGPGEGKKNRCDALAELALSARVTTDASSRAARWATDFPWPLRFPRYDGYSAGFQVLGGWGVDVAGGDGFYRADLASGVLRAEANPDRHYWGMLFGLVCHVKDARSDFTCWKIPFAASWFRRGHGGEAAFRWSALWGILAYGSEREARVLLVPVWHRAN